MAKDYKIHLGEYVSKRIELSDLHIKRDIASQLQIGKNSLSERFKRKHYGTVYDLLETSEALGENLFMPVIAILEKGNIPIEEFYSENEVKGYQERIKSLERQIEKLEEDKAKLFKLLSDLTGKK